MTGKTPTSERKRAWRSPKRKLLSLSYLTKDEFAKEYWDSLANGGVFVISADDFELREVVDVRLELLFCEEMIHLQAEVVHVVGKELAKAGGSPGVAVQFALPAPELRERLAPFAGPRPRAATRAEEQREQPRAPARVSARLDTSSGKLEAHTEDLSRSGVLLAVEESVPIGEQVRVAITHPTTGEELEVDAKVVRHAQTETGGAAIAVQFESSQATSEEVSSFVDDVQAADHTRRLGGISGSIQELGLPHLLQMLASGSPAGTLTVTRGDDRGTVVFQDGNLVAARLGSVSGTKALKRMLSWTEGGFEFHAVAEEVRDDEPLPPLDSVVLDALNQIDDDAQRDVEPVPHKTRLRLHPRRLAAEGKELDEIEEAVLDLAAENLAVGVMLDMIPETDGRIHAAIRDLLARGLVEAID
jgi:Tfp pilus assembly protein PilZ